MRNRRRRSLFAVALVAAFIGATGVAQAQEQIAVQLGDSFIAGNAGRWEGNSPTPPPHNGTDRGAAVYEPGPCSRSDVAEIRTATLAGVDSVRNFACSGATTETVTSDQLPRLQQELDAGNEVKLIVLLVGGNNLQFTSIVAACTFGSYSLLSGGQGPPCNSEQQALLAQRIGPMQTNVEALIGRIQEMMEGQPSYRFILQDYPSPVPAAANVRYPQGDGSQSDPRVSEGGCPLYDVDLNWAKNSAVPQIREALRAAATNTGVEFLDISNAVNGHEVCHRRSSLVGPEGPNPRTAEWFRWVTLTQIQGDFNALAHPNAYAQRAFGTCLTLVWSQEPGNYACQNTPGGDTTQMYLGDPPIEDPPPEPPVGGPPRDTTAPDTQITSGPRSKTKKKRASFSFSSSEPNSTFECKLDAGPFVACASGFSVKVKKGKHTFQVRAKDAAGNVDQSPATDSWRRKKKKPKN